MEMTLWVQIQIIVIFVGVISGTGFLGYLAKKAFREWIRGEK